MTLQPLTVRHPGSVGAVNTALAVDRLILLLQKGDGDTPRPIDLYRAGTIGVIRQMATALAGLNIIVEGVAWVRAEEIAPVEALLHGRLTPADLTSGRSRAGSSRPSSRLVQ